MTNKEFGRRGEYLARLYLEKKGYTFIRANFSGKHGEIDLVMQENDEIVFVEVKTRTSLEFGNPAEAVDSDKINHILKTAKYYLYSNRIENANMRFDIIEVFIYKGRYRVNHIKQIM